MWIKLEYYYNYYYFTTEREKGGWERNKDCDIIPTWWLRESVSEEEREKGEAKKHFSSK